MPNGWFWPSRNTSRVSATPSPSASRSSVMRLGLTPIGGGAPHRADHGVVEERPGRAVRAHRPRRPARRRWAAPRSSGDARGRRAKALTLSPGAAIGVWPGLQPRAVGIFSVGMLPCGLAAGIAGALPHAGSGEPPVSRRIWSAAPPITATPRAKRVEKLTALASRCHGPTRPQEGIKVCGPVRRTARRFCPRSSALCAGFGRSLGVLQPLLRLSGAPAGRDPALDLAGHPLEPVRIGRRGNLGAQLTGDVVHRGTLVVSCAARSRPGPKPVAAVFIGIAGRLRLDFARQKIDLWRQTGPATSGWERRRARSDDRGPLGNPHCQ